MGLQMRITRNGECVVSSRQLLGEWNDREDCEKMAGKGEPQRSKKNCKLKRGGKEKRLTKD